MQAHASPTLPPKLHATDLPLNSLGSIHEWRWFGVIVVVAVAALAVLSGALVVLTDAQAGVAHAAPVQMARARCAPAVAFQGGALTQCGAAAEGFDGSTVTREPAKAR